MVLSELDRHLIDRCLARAPHAWQEFVDRYVGLVMHVIHQTAQARSLRLSPEDREDLAADVFVAIVRDDMALLRHFRGQASLATYLAVVARRVVVRGLLERQIAAQQLSGAAPLASAAGNHDHEERHANRDEVERLLEELEGHEAQVVRLYHLEGKSYREISSAVGMPENSIGPTLSRAREKMRRARADADTAAS